MFNARAYCQTDYAALCGWWGARGLPSVPEVFISHAKGLVMSHDGKDVAAGFIYFDEAHKIGLVDWITTNPEFSREPLLIEALSDLIDLLEKTALEAGCVAAFSFIAKDTGLHRMLVREGWNDPKSQPHVFLYKSWPSQH